MSWFVVQLGARENYSLARALHQTRALAGLVTDAWVSDSSPLTRLPRNVASKLFDRYHNDLAEANAIAFNNRLLAFELNQKLSGRSGWDLIIRRNQWFQKQVVRQLRPILRPEHTIFSYSYTAKEIFALGKQVGCRLVLGQIDPGIGEENIVADEVAKLADIDTGFVRAPQAYWDDWRSECDLADHIVVNSAWSKDLLVDDGVSVDKIEIIPLVECSGNGLPPDRARTFPESFTTERPLNVLYLGQVIPRKGIHYVLEAAKALADAPVKFSVVGNPGPWREHLNSVRNIDVVGRIPRGDVCKYYQAADLFLFPTLSDGFGLTQLEAQAWCLPIVCSKFCGRVVEHGHTGLLLPSVSAASIVECIKSLLQAPSTLNSMSIAITQKRFGLRELGKQLLCMTEEKVERR